MSQISSLNVQSKCSFIKVLNKTILKLVEKSSYRLLDVEIDTRVDLDLDPDLDPDPVTLLYSLVEHRGHNIALEIQATLPSPPSSVKPMMMGEEDAHENTLRVSRVHIVGTSSREAVLC